MVPTRSRTDPIHTVCRPTCQPPQTTQKQGFTSLWVLLEHQADVRVTCHTQANFRHHTVVDRAVLCRRSVPRPFLRKRSFSVGPRPSVLDLGLPILHPNSSHSSRGHPHSISCWPRDDNDSRTCASTEVSPEVTQTPHPALTLHTTL